MVETTNIVVTWLLATGATFLFVRLIWIKNLHRHIKEQQQQLQAITDELYTTKIVVSGLKKELIDKFSDLENRHIIMNNAVTNYKNDTTKIFETITEGFEFINNERTVMIKDVAELKRRVRMNSNETKRQNYQRRHRENSGTV